MSQPCGILDSNLAASLQEEFTASSPNNLLAVQSFSRDKDSFDRSKKNSLIVQDDFDDDDDVALAKLSQELDLIDQINLEAKKFNQLRDIVIDLKNPRFEIRARGLKLGEIRYADARKVPMVPAIAVKLVVSSPH
jgi:hypothetical protein